MIIGAIVALLAVKLIIALLGFGGGGVVAGSLAAWMMSIMAPIGIAAGSIFARLQSAGAGGLGTPCIILVAIIGAALFYFFFYG